MAKLKSPARGKGELQSPHVDAFHGLAGRIVRAIEPHTEASAGALLVQFLAAFGFVVGRCAHYFVDGACHYPNLFVVLVGNTAKARKGTSWNRVRKVFEELTQWPRDRVTTGLSSGEGLIENVSDSLADKRLLVIQTEFGSVLTVMMRSGNTLSPVIRDAWDGNDLRVMTKKQPASASGEHIAIIAHTTADELLERLDTTDLWNGFANRFLWCSVSRARLLSQGGNLNDSVIRPLINDLRDVIKWSRNLKGRRIDWNKSAAKEWENAYARLAHDTPGLIGAVTSRADAQVVRLALVYSLLDRSTEIRTEHLRAALAVWNFCEASARAIFARSTGDPVADRIRDALKEADRGMTRTEISALFQHHRASGDIGRALELLQELSIAECRREKSAGRSTERWFAATEK